MSGAVQTVLAPPAGPARRAVRDPLVAGLVGLCLAVAVGLLVARPAPYLVNALGQLAAFAILAVSLDLVWGYLGILSLGHGLFFAIGGYVCAMHLLSHGVAVTGVQPDFVQFMGWKSLPAYWAGLDHPAYALVLALALAGLVAFLFGLASFRSRVNGVYFSIISQALVYVAMLLMYRNDTGLGGNNGMTGSRCCSAGRWAPPAWPPGWPSPPWWRWPPCWPARGSSSAAPWAGGCSPAATTRPACAPWATAPPG